MNKLIVFAALALMLGVSVPKAHASIVCGDPSQSNSSITYTLCSNGSPENVVNEWGMTNSQLPHILQGQTSNGLSCPFWFPMYCVDIRGTAWYQARWK